MRESKYGSKLLHKTKPAIDCPANVGIYMMFLVDEAGKNIVNVEYIINMVFALSRAERDA